MRTLGTSPSGFSADLKDKLDQHKMKKTALSSAVFCDPEKVYHTVKPYSFWACMKSSYLASAKRNHKF